MKRKKPIVVCVLGWCVDCVMLLLLVLDGIACVNGDFRCWAYETAVLLDCHREMSDEIPYNDYFDYYTPDYKVLFCSSSFLFFFVSSICLLCFFFFFFS